MAGTMTSTSYHLICDRAELSVDGRLRPRITELADLRGHRSHPSQE
jgi:hypothetical protein